MKSRDLILALAGAAVFFLSPVVATTSNAEKPPRAGLKLLAGGAELLPKAPVQAVVASGDCGLYDSGEVAADGGPKDVLKFTGSRSICAQEYLLSGALKKIEVSSSLLQATLKFAGKLVETTPGPCSYSFAGKLVGKVAHQSPLSIEAEEVGKLQRKVSSSSCAGAYVGHFTAAFYDNNYEEPVSLQISSPAREVPPRGGTSPTEGES